MCSVENVRRDFAFNQSRPYEMLHGGYVVSPWAPTVIARVQQQVAELTEQVPNDVLFQDQIDARLNYTDYGAFAPNATSYVQNWLKHTRGFSGKLLMTEGGFDRLAEIEIGFNGGPPLDEITGRRQDGRVTALAGKHFLLPLCWRATRFSSMSVTLPASITASKQVLTWNASQGYMLTCNLTETTYGGGLRSSWLEVVSAFQKHVFARYSDVRITGYEHVLGRSLARCSTATRSRPTGTRRSPPPSERIV